MKTTRGMSPYDLAVRNRHTTVRRIFEPSASDKDVTEFAYEGSSLLQACNNGNRHAVSKWIVAAAIESTVVDVETQHESGDEADEGLEEATGGPLATVAVAAALQAQFDRAWEIVADRYDELIKEPLDRGAQIRIETAHDRRPRMNTPNALHRELTEAPDLTPSTRDGADAPVDADSRRQSTRMSFDDAALSTQRSASTRSKTNSVYDKVADKLDFCQHLPSDADFDELLPHGDPGAVSAAVKTALDTCADNNVTCLMLAARGGSYAIVKTLIALRADVFVRSQKGCTALAMAAENARTVKGAYECVALLLNQAMNEELAGESIVPGDASSGPRTLSALINMTDEYGCTPLMLASQYGDFPTVTMLVQANANVTATSTDRMDALMMAARDGRGRTAELLIKNDADINERNFPGATALVLASDYGHTETVRVLIDMGAKVNVQRLDGRTALHRASLYGHFSTVRLLLEHHARVDMVSKSGATALLAAATNGHERVVSSLLGTQKGIEMLDEVPEASKQKYTPLMAATAYGHISVVNTLLKQGANVNYMRPAPFFDTALMRAAKFNRSGVVDVLLRTRNAGGAHLEALSTRRNTEVVDLLLTDDEGRNVRASGTRARAHRQRAPRATVLSAQRPPSLLQALHLSVIAVAVAEVHATSLLS